MIEAANREFRAARAADRRRHAKADRVPCLIHAIDYILYELEELNTLGVEQVPYGLWEASANVMLNMPGEPPDLRLDPSIRTTMDVLFRAQAYLLQLIRPEVEYEDEAAV
jgi:hypothetical protein